MKNITLTIQANINVPDDINPADLEIIGKIHIAKKDNVGEYNTTTTDYQITKTKHQTKNTHWLTEKRG